MPALFEDESFSGLVRRKTRVKIDGSTGANGGEVDRICHYYRRRRRVLYTICGGMFEKRHLGWFVRRIIVRVQRKIRQAGVRPCLLLYVHVVVVVVVVVSAGDLTNRTPGVIKRRAHRFDYTVGTLVRVRV